MIVRPNPGPNFSAENYQAKAARWKELWPELTVLRASTHVSSLRKQGTHNHYRTTPEINPGLRRGGLISFFRKQCASFPTYPGRA